jgi:hypothetical protein
MRSRVGDRNRRKADKESRSKTVRDRRSRAIKMIRRNVWRV